MIAACTLSQAAYLSLYEFFTIYSPRDYLISWIPRIGLQLAFFYLMAGFIGGGELRTFLLVGNSAHLSVHGVLVYATQSIGRELGAGTMILLLATPARMILVLIGRNLAMAANGVLTAAIGLAISLIALGAPLDASRLAGAGMLLVVIAGSAYGLAVLIGSVMLRFPEYQNAASNLVGLSMAVLCGVNVPVEILPGPVQAVANVLPLTHGLAGLRALLAGAAPDAILGPVAVEIVVGLAYVTLAFFSFKYFLERARARGTLDFH